MKIAIFVDNYLSKEPLCDSIRLLKEWNEKKGNEVFIFTTYSKDGQKEEKNKGKDKNSYENVFKFKADYIKSYPQFKFSISPFLNAKKLLKETGCELIHNFSLGALGMAAATFKKELKIKGLITLIDILHYFKAQSSRTDKIVGDIVLNYIRWLSKSFEIVHYPSNYAKQNLEQILKQSINAEIANLPINVKDQEKKSIDKNNAEKSKDEKAEYEICYIGPFEKGVDIDKIKKNMDGIKNKTGKEIKFIELSENSQYKPEQRKELYKKLKIYVEPRNFFEYPFYSLECLCLKKPVLCHKDSCLTEFLNDELKRYLVYDDEAFISDMLLRLLNNNEVEKELKNFNNEINEKAQKLNEIYEKLLK